MFVIVANQMVIMFILIMIGCVIRKVQLVDHSGAKTLSNVLLLLINPLLILNSFLTVEYDAAMIRNLLLTILFALITHILGILAARLLLPGKDPDTMIERFSAVYSNCGFMGIPLVQSFLGAEGVFFLTAYVVVFNILVWTHGLVIITGDASLKRVAGGLRSPVMFAIAAGMVCYFLRIRLPGPVQGAISYVASMNTAMGMFVAGAALAEAHPLAALKKRRIYAAFAAKLLVMPALSVAVMLVFRAPEPVYYTVAVAAACPVATTCTMMAMRYDRNYHYASELYVLMTLLSMVSIPAVIALAEMLY